MDNLNATVTLSRLSDIMTRLRSEDGCPWDRQQSHESLVPYLIEEAYELIEAIDAKDPAAIRDELGDVLLQVVFHARILQENGHSDLAEVAEAISEKLIRRHPHVFACECTAYPEELHIQWDQIKKQEHARAGKPRATLDGIPSQLPSLMKAAKLASKAHRAGFVCLENAQGLSGVEIRLKNLREAIESEKEQDLEGLYGELLFEMANIGRTIHVDAENALRKSLGRFIQRFEKMEQLLAEIDTTLKDTTAERQRELWLRTLEAKE